MSLNLVKADFDKLAGSLSETMKQALIGLLKGLQSNTDDKKMGAKLQEAYRDIETGLHQSAEKMQQSTQTASQASDIIADLKQAALGIEARERDQIATITPPGTRKEPEETIQPR